MNNKKVAEVFFQYLQIPAGAVRVTFCDYIDGTEKSKVYKNIRSANIAEGIFYRNIAIKAARV